MPFTRAQVAKKLASLVRAGCWVDIAYANANDAVLDALKDIDGKPIGVIHCAVPWQGRNVRPHSKYMLIDGATPRSRGRTRAATTMLCVR